MSARAEALQNRVAAFVQIRRATTVADLLEAFPGLSKAQIHDALHNAKQKQMVRCIKRSKPNIWGAWDATTAEYREPTKQPECVAVTSVFHQATPIKVQGSGTVYRPLGD